MARINGTRFADSLVGTETDDIVWAGKGEDYASAEDGNDLVLGGWGADILYGDAGDDVVQGGAGADRVNGDVGNDRLYGGRGDDQLVDYDGINRLEGSSGNDILTSCMGRGAETTLVGGRGIDTFSLYWDQTQDWSITFVEDFRPGEGDRFSLFVLNPPAPGSETPLFPFGQSTELNATETFASLDTNADGRMDDADDWVVQHGNDLHFARPNGTVVMQGIDHLDWSMLIG